MDLKQKTICPKCKKEKSPTSRGGSLTAFMFHDVYCSCGGTAPAGQFTRASEIDRCSKCGMIVGRSGSITSFLFQDLSCQCKGKSEKHAQTNQSTRVRRKTGTQSRSSFEADRPFKSADSEAFVKLCAGNIVGDYRLIDIIGRGGMGLVFLAEHLPLRRRCALKFLTPSLVSESSRSMFQSEAKILAGLNHPSICQIYDFGIHEGHLPFYSMEYLIGESLDAVLLNQQTLSAGAAQEIFARVAQGLAYAHSHGVVHKDIKPANIMLLPDAGDDIAIKILDFGIAELLQPETGRLTESAPEDIAGTANYMSPEQFRGKEIDHRCDIYGLGCTIFETLTGEPPYTGGTTWELAQQHEKASIPGLQQKTGVEFSRELEAVLRKTLAKHPDDRYQNANDLAEDLASLKDNQPLKFAQKELRELIPATALKTPRAVTLSGHWIVLLVLGAFTVAIVFGYSTVVSLVEGTAQSAKKQSTRSKHKKKGSGSDTQSSRLEYSDIKSLMQTARQAIIEKRFQDVIGSTSAAIEKGATDGEPFVLRGMAFSFLEKPEPAIADLTKGMSLEPALATQWAIDCLSKSYIELRQFDNALIQINRALKIEQSAERLRRKGQVLCQLDRIKDAIASFDQALSLSPNDYWVLYDRGSAYAILNRNDLAVKDFSRVISLRPMESRGYAARAKCYLRMGKSAQAKSDQEKVDQLGKTDWNNLKPNSPEFEFGL